MLSTSQFHDPHTQTRQKLDKDISQLEAQLVLLKLARNALAPVTCLHPEILQEIFFLAHYSSPHKGKATLLLTWICHRWRELAHNTASLWSHIDFKRREWIEAALSRAKNRELEFNLLHFTKSPMQDIPFLVSYTIGNLSRIRFLKISSRYGKNRAIIPTSAPEWLTPAPLLVHLSLRSITLPPNPFSGTLPRLQFLEIRDCCLEWDTLPVPPGLKSLSLAYPVGSLPRLDDLIRILQIAGPTLEELQLGNMAFADDHLPTTPHIDRIRLDKLKSIKIDEEGPNEIALMFNLINLPPHINIELSILEWSGESRLSQALIACRNIETWPMDVLEMRVEEDNVMLRITEDWSNAAGNSNQINDLESSAKTVIQIDVTTVDEPSTLLPALTLLPLQPIKKVSFVGGGYETQDATFLDYIGGLGTVQELRIEGPFLTTFLPSIGVQSDKLSDDSPQGLPSELAAQMQYMDALKHSLNPETITRPQAIISFTGLRDLEIHGNPDDEDFFTSDDVGVLQTWLEWRNQFDLKVERLCISGVRTPHVSWLTGAFGGLVDKFETHDLEEEDEEGETSGED